MAREATITQEQVSAAADRIRASGGKVGSRAVREALGSGSMGTILRFLQAWQGTQERKSVTIDDTLDPAIARAISGQITARVKEATASVTASLADLQAETAVIIAENERQAADLETAAAALAALAEQHAALTGRTRQLESDAARTAVELATERQAAEAARVNLAKAELRLEAVPRIEAEITQVRAELAAERIKSAEQHEAAAVATAMLDAERLHRQSIDAQLTDARARIIMTEQELNSMRTDAAELRGRRAAPIVTPP